MTVQYLEISGEKMAVLRVADYERLLDMAEDRADELAADRAEQRRIDGEEYVPIELVDRLIAGDNALRVWRQYRGLTLDALGQKAKLSQSMLSQLESGNRLGTPPTWRALAKALNVDVDDIMPDNPS